MLYLKKKELMCNDHILLNNFQQFPFEKTRNSLIYDPWVGKVYLKRTATLEQFLKKAKKKRVENIGH